MERLYVTTPLYYVNAEPHLGHTYTTVVADTWARFLQGRGASVLLTTGTDEHGDKIAAAAAAAGSPPQAHADRISRTFQTTWDTIGIRYDQFIRTTDPAHARTVQEALARVHAAGDIYFGSYGGLYCTGCERFYTEKELVVAHFERHPNAITPEAFRNEALAMLRSEALGDLCISRPKSRLTWGIELPFDRNFVTYVWFDALFGYVSALRAQGEGTFTAFWPETHHVIGKDILKPHAVFWPAMLMAAGLPLYRQLHVHGYWNSGESKMSKSLGNVIRPLDMKRRFGMDAFRYFLLRDMAFGHDATFSEDAFITRVNADLANNLGNLISRTLAMQQRYFDGSIQPLGPPAPEDHELRETFAVAAREVPVFAERIAFHRALESLWRAIDHANKYIVTTSPFTLAKDPDRRPRAGAVLHHLCEGLYVTAVLLAPFLPETSDRLFGLLDVPPATRLDPGWTWGGTFAAGHRTKPPAILFPRIEVTAAS
jgi:methionyl-tRNA synthetase